MATEKTEKQEILIAEKYPQMDLFLCDISDAIPKDIMQEMEHPFYSLSKKPEMKPRRYENGDNWIEIAPSYRGMATIYDKDILIYCISQIMAKMNAGEPVSKRVRIHSYDLLQFTNRGTSGRDYMALEVAIERLRGTQIKTNVRIGDEIITDIFGLIDGGTIQRKHGLDGRLLWCDVVISEFVFKALQAKQTLTLHRDYFRLRKPIERRVYEMARKHCGSQKSIKMSLSLLHHKSGSQSSLKLFKQHFKKIVKTDHLPDYHVELDEKDMVTFSQKAESKIGTTRKKKPTLQEGKRYTESDIQRTIDNKCDKYTRALASQKNLDFYDLKEQFADWINSKGVAPANMSAAFIKFVQQKKGY